MDTDYLNRCATHVAVNWMPLVHFYFFILASCHLYDYEDDSGLLSNANQGPVILAEQKVSSALNGIASVTSALYLF